LDELLEENENPDRQPKKRKIEAESQELVVESVFVNRKTNSTESSEVVSQSLDVSEETNQKNYSQEL